MGFCSCNQRHLQMPHSTTSESVLFLFTNYKTTSDFPSESLHITSQIQGYFASFCIHRERKEMAGKIPFSWIVFKSPLLHFFLPVKNRNQHALGASVFSPTSVALTDFPPVTPGLISSFRDQVFHWQNLILLVSIESYWLPKQFQHWEQVRLYQKLMSQPL